MGRETKDKRFLLKIRAADSARRIKCPRVGPARFRSSPPSAELSLRALLTARCPESFFWGSLAPFDRERIHRRIQGRHAAACFARKVAQDRDARLPIPAPVRSRGKMSVSGRQFNPG